MSAIRTAPDSRHAGEDTACLGIFQALADPTRRAILKKISRQPQSVTKVASPFEMSLAAVSKHLKVLERAGIILRTRSGRHFHSRLNPDALRTAEAWISDYQRFLERRLDSPERFLKTPSSSR